MWVLGACVPPAVKAVAAGLIQLSRRREQANVKPSGALQLIDVIANMLYPCMQ